MAVLLVGIGAAGLALSATPAMAWWQFYSLVDGGERKASPRFNTEEECRAALKAAEAALRRAYPNRYPLVGSCEQFE